MTRPLLIDLFCGAGGCAVGYHRAGFDVLGVDIDPQPRYPFGFIHGDVFEVWDDLPHDEAAAYHASPPCQAYTTLAALQEGEYPTLVEKTRVLLQETGKPFVIENVPGAPLLSPIRLCGSSFGLRVRRHRLFESSFFLMAPPCQHFWQDQNKIYSVYQHGQWTETGVAYVHGTGGRKANKHWPGAMGIDWMTRDELAQAIPPAYTEYIGKHLMKHIKVTA